MSAPAIAAPGGITVLVVDDDLDFARMVERLLASEGYRASHVGSAGAALEALARAHFDIVLTDLKMPGASGLELLRAVRERHPATQVIVMTGYGTIQSTVEAMKLGAADFLPKPFENEELLLHLEGVAKVRALEREVERLREELRGREGAAGIVGSSAAMARVLDRVEAAARTTSSVLISGETGTGKELVARAIHAGGPRARARFVGLNCAALPRENLESELFGHVRGAFPNALRDHEGLFRAAASGTLFLDEISDMPIETQAKLLRAIEDGRVRPIGSTEEVEVDCRIVAATNRDALACVRAGTLREDLYYRLAVIPIELPPLRARTEDIPLLVRHFVARMNERFERRVRGVAPDALEALVRYPWPGNVRELRNVIEGVFALAKNDLIERADLPPRVQGGAGAAEWADGPLPALEPALHDLEKGLILRALELAGGNKSRAAEMLSVSRKRIYRKLEEYGILTEETHGARDRDD